MDNLIKNNQKFLAEQFCLADMQVNNYGPSINFYDPNARTRLAIGSTTMVASHLSINGLTERNTPSSIVLFDANGGLVWRNP